MAKEQEIKKKEIELADDTLEKVSGGNDIQRDSNSTGHNCKYTTAECLNHQKGQKPCTNTKCSWYNA